MHIPFSKYHGAGNDFILIDNREDVYPLDDPHLIRRWCDRHSGIGADGVLIVEKSGKADNKMRIFNADGSIPAMCGNGIRCAFDFLTKNTAVQQMGIEIGERVLSCRRIDDQISVALGAPQIFHWPISLDLPWTRLLYVLDTGVPHAVVFVEDILHIPLCEWGKQVRFHPAFAPGGVNVDFVQIASDGSMMLRTYERGVEGETLSCGTGAAAAAFAAAEVHGIAGPIAVKTRSGFYTDHFQKSLQFSFPLNSHGEKEIEMIGPAHRVFTGQIDLYPNRAQSWNLGCVKAPAVQR
jgi:diaminopimelate epimerase